MEESTLDPLQVIQEVMQINFQQENDEMIKKFENYIMSIKINPQNYQLAIQLLSMSSEMKVVWFSVNVLDYLVTMYWVPHSLNPDPSASIFTEEIKGQIRAFLLSYLTGPIVNLNETASNFILKLISKLMKVDFQNEGNFWIQSFANNLTNYNYVFYFFRIIKIFGEDVQRFDHVISSATTINTKEAFYNVIPQICESTVSILSDPNITIPIALEYFKMIDSFMQCKNPNFFAQIPGIIELFLTFSAPDQPVELACEAHRCLYTLFTRINLITLFEFEVEKRQQILAACLSFFENVLASTEFNEEAFEFLSTLLVAFQPLAERYVFRSDMFEDEALNQFLCNFEEWTWEAFGTELFKLFIDIWIDLYYGITSLPDRGQKFSEPFVRLVDHILQMMVDDTQYERFAEKDLEDINEMINYLYQETYLSDQIYHLFQQTTSYAVNHHLCSAEFLLRCFIHLMGHIPSDDPRISVICDSLILFMNELMVHCAGQNMEKTIEHFALTKFIIYSYVSRFSRMSDYFLEKIFHLLKVSIEINEYFVQHMLELLLETLRIYRPVRAARIVLEGLVNAHSTFINLSNDNYALYLSCFIIVATMPPTDLGEKMLVRDPGLLIDMYSVTFQSLLDFDKCAFALKIMLMSVNCIMLSQAMTKDLVYAAFSPHIGTVLQIYEQGCPESIMQPLFDFLYGFISAFTAQIGDSINEIIARLFAPIERSISSLQGGTIESFAVKSFLGLLFRIAQFKTAITITQTENIVSFIDGFGAALLSSSVDLLMPALNIIKCLVEDRWTGVNPECGNRLLHIVFYEGIMSQYPDAMILCMNTIQIAQRKLRIFDSIPPEYIYNAFSTVCTEMARSPNSILMDNIFNFVTFLAGQTPNFVENYIHAYIRSIDVSESDQIALAAHFQNYTSEQEFKHAFPFFCTDVAYLTMGREYITSA